MKIRKYNRYPLSNLFMFVGLIIAFIAVICGSYIFQRVENGKKESIGYKYINQKSIHYYNMDGTNLDVLNLSKSTEINIEVAGLSMMVGEETRDTTIAVSLNEELPYNLIEGRFPTEEEIQNHVNVVNIGRYCEKFVYEKDGKKYIDYDNIPYEVIGILGAPKSDVLDYVTYFVYDCLNEYHKNIFNSLQLVTVRYGSDYINVDNEISKILASADENLQSEIDTSGNANITIINGHEKDLFYFMIYGFAIGICVIMSELWIFERKEEIAILKTVGLSLGYIEIKLFASIMGNIGIATILSYIIILVSGAISGEYMISVDSVLMVLGIMVVSAIAILILPAIKLRNIEPAKCINARGDY